MTFLSAFTRVSSYLDWISSLTNTTLNINTDNSSTSGPSPKTYSTPSGPSGGLSGGAIAGIVIGSVVGVAFLGAIIGLIAYCVTKSNKSPETENDITKKIPPMP